MQYWRYTDERQADTTRRQLPHNDDDNEHAPCDRAVWTRRGATWRQTMTSLTYLVVGRCERGEVPLDCEPRRIRNLHDNICKQEIFYRNAAKIWQRVQSCIIWRLYKVLGPLHSKTSGDFWIGGSWMGTEYGGRGRLVADRSVTDTNSTCTCAPHMLVYKYMYVNYN